MITLMTSGFSTTLGSATRNPETSVQFSYISALTAFARIEPVTSEPPRENVFTMPSVVLP